MSWYYADAGRQIGPVDEPALDDLVRAGVVRDDTLVWREGMANWQPHGAARGPKPPAPMPAIPIGPDSSFCSECGRPFPAAQLVALGNANVCAQCKPIYLQRVREGGQAIGAVRYAGFWIRFVAYVIDLIILGFVQAIIMIPLAMLGVGSAVAISQGNIPNIGAIIAAYSVIILVSVAISITYEVYFISKKGATLGKMALGLKVIRPDNRPIPAGLAAGRYLSKIISGMIFYVGFMMAGWDEQKRSLHDRICDTRVIYVK
jgi:uncharacterized RDD family membrane protein YckC